MKHIFPGGGFKTCLLVMMVFILLFCAFITGWIQPGVLTVEGAVGSSDTNNASNLGNGPFLSSGLNLASVAVGGSNNKVACADKWATLYANASGFSMVNALEEPDGTCIIDFMDTNGLYHTQTFRSESNNGGGSAGGATPVPSSATTPPAHHQYTESEIARTVVY